MVDGRTELTWLEEVYTVHVCQVDAPTDRSAEYQSKKSWLQTENHHLQFSFELALTVAVC